MKNIRDHVINIEYRMRKKKKRQQKKSRMRIDLRKTSELGFAFKPVKGHLLLNGGREC